MTTIIVQLLLTATAVGLALLGYPSDAVTCAVGSLVISALKED